MKSQPKFLDVNTVQHRRHLVISLLSFIACVGWTESEIVVNTVAGQFSTDVDSYHNGPLLSSLSVTSYMACIQSCLNARCPPCSVINFYGGNERRHANCELRGDYTNNRQMQHKDGWILATMIIAGPSGSNLEKLCDEEKLVSRDWYPSCQAALVSNNMQSKMYAILPTRSIPGSVPMSIRCIDNRTAVLSHNLNIEQRLEGPISSSVNVSVEYNVSTANLTATVLSSTICTQNLTIKCFSSGFKPHYWISRTGKRRDYFGPSTLGSGCACGVSNTCAKSGIKCNCYANDDVWRQDSVVFQNDTELPVMQLVFNDLDQTSEKVHFLLSEMHCLL